MGDATRRIVVIPLLTAPMSKPITLVLILFPRPLFRIPLAPIYGVHQGPDVNAKLPCNF